MKLTWGFAVTAILLCLGATSVRAEEIELTFATGAQPGQSPHPQVSLPWAERVNAVLFSPVFEDPEGKWQGLQPRTLVEWMLADGLPVRLGLQIHKFVWEPATKGV